MRLIPLAIAAALSAAMPVSALAQADSPPAAAQADPALDAMVAGYQNMVGTTSPDGATVRRVWADGRAMVFSVEAPADYAREASWIIGVISQGICERQPDFFDNGRTIRIDIDRAGTVETASRNSCSTETYED